MYTMNLIVKQKSTFHKSAPLYKHIGIQYYLLLADKEYIFIEAILFMLLHEN